MFSLKNYVKKGLLDAVGKQAEYWIILNSVGWLEKGVFDESDLEEINKAIEDYKASLIPTKSEEETTEENPVENEEDENA